MVRGVITSTCLWFAKVHTLHVWKELPFCPFGIAFCLSGGRCGVCRWGPELMQTWWQVPIVDHRTAAASSCLAALTSAPGVFVFAAIKENRSCQGKAQINCVWRKTSFLLARHDNSHRASKMACAGLRQHWTLALFDFCWCLRTFQHTPGTDPRSPINSLGRNSFHMGFWGCLGSAPGVCWGSLRWWVYSTFTTFEPNSCAFKASCNPRCCWRLLESYVFPIVLPLCLSRVSAFATALWTHRFPESPSSEITWSH